MHCAPAAIVTGVQRWIAISYACGVAVFVVASGYWTLADHFSLPYIDDWRIFDERLSKSLVEWLFTPHNGHRLPITLALVRLDYAWLGGHMQLPAIATWLTALACSATLYVGLLAGRDPGARDSGGMASVSIAAFAFAIFSLFGSAVMHNFVYVSLSHANLMACFAFSIALACVVQRNPRWTAVFAAAIVCTFSVGGGIACWPALAAVASASGAKKRTVLGLALAGGVSAMLYSIGVERPATISIDAALATVLARPFELARAAAAFVGNAVGHSAQGLGTDPQWTFAISTAAGAAGIAFALFHGWRLYRRPESRRPSALLALGLMVFAAGVALLASMVRLPFVPIDFAIRLRFVGWSGVFWAGVALALPAGLHGRSSAFHAAVLVALVAVSLAALPGIRHAQAQHDLRRNQLDRLAIALQLGVRDDTLAGHVSLERPASVWRVSRRFLADGRSFVGERAAALIGERLRDHYALMTPSPCEGMIQVTEELPASDGRGVKLFGRAWNHERSAPPDSVALVDARGFVRGLGSVMRPTEIARNAIEGRLWSGYIAGFDRSERYYAYGLFERDHTACSIRPIDADPADRGP